MASALPPGAQPGSVTLGRDGFTHSAPDEHIRVNTYQLTLVVERLISRQPQRPTPPSREPLVAPGSVFITILLALVTADFKDALGVSADVWAAVALVSLGLACIWLLRTGLAYLDATRRYKTAVASFTEPTAETVIEEMLREMERTRQREAELT